jgi:anti-sigma factor RsiW
MAGCLEESTVLAFLGGTLPPEERSMVEEHIAACSACADLITWTAADQASSTMRLPGHEGRPFVGQLHPGARVGVTRSWAPSGAAAWARCTPPITQTGPPHRPEGRAGPRRRHGRAPRAAATRGQRDRAPLAPERRHRTRRGHVRRSRVHRDGAYRRPDHRSVVARRATHLAADPGHIHRRWPRPTRQTSSTEISNRRTR